MPEPAGHPARGALTPGSGPWPAPRPRQASALVVRPAPRPSSAPVLPAPAATGPATTRRPAVVDQPARPAAPDGELANQLATVLAGVLKVDSVPLDGHFFDDLDADSLLMAQFCARLRKRPDLPTVSIKDIYRHTTITALAAATGGSGAPAATRPRGWTGGGLAVGQRGWPPCWPACSRSTASRSTATSSTTWTPTRY